LITASSWCRHFIQEDAAEELGDDARQQLHRNNIVIGTTTQRWHHRATGALLYSLFLVWYGGWPEPLSKAEIDGGFMETGY